MLLVLLYLNAHAEDNVSIDANATQKLYIDHFTDGLDTMHSYVSHKVKVLSSNVDAELTDVAHDLDGNESTIGAKTQHQQEHNASATMSQYVGSFFKDETFLDVNNQSYLRMRIGPERNSKEGNKWKLKLNFNINLPHTQDSLNLFIGEDAEEEMDEQIGVPERDDPNIGLRYFAPDVMENFKSNFTLGVRGINPYARFYMRYSMDYENWRIYPTQELEYLSEDNMGFWGYAEETRLYCDRKMGTREMLRLLFHRSSEAQKEGQRYGTSLSYFNTLNKKRIGFNAYVSLSGDSRYYENHPEYEPKGYERTGIDMYRVGVIFRQGLYKDWLFYEIEPTLEWARKYHFDRNEIVKFNLEFWFGNS